MAYRVLLVESDTNYKGAKKKKWKKRSRKKKKKKTTQK